MWKYNRKEIKAKSINELISELNILGSDGWEIIYYSEIRPVNFSADWTAIVLIKKVENT